ncbi:hypothetical protein GCM10009840_21400 [Pseudolysinimonas kribbensis]|uniref:Uncharacterized protein n=1 Tax=Pseudolysinimonas kribbensis TaxID=433641 RepID=A0ABQ6K3B4_9MICO|nr:hypothetical protein GCM10025881_00640 [Pseudolysinimonas kribbensis]GMA93246.1 hypothetical protein GCM10025881_00700 [Pseudolysinimonas kribbensis]GMA97148.1 hypothetical protein GCM10025881_39720 [Pseudolysinimonas kribbensis]
MTLNHEAPICSAAIAVSRIIGAIVAGSPGMVKSMKWNPKRMTQRYAQPEGASAQGASRAGPIHRPGSPDGSEPASP